MASVLDWYREPLFWLFPVGSIVVSIVAFILGVFFGMGTFYIIAMNGFMLGAIFAFTHQHGMAGELLKFVVAHGMVELSVICIAGAAGMMLGESLIRPTHATRRESFRHAAGKTSKVLLLCALLLIVCGFIEGYVSPDPDYPLVNRLVIIGAPPPQGNPLRKEIPGFVNGRRSPLTAVCGRLRRSAPARAGRRWRW